MNDVKRVLELQKRLKRINYIMNFIVAEFQKIDDKLKEKDVEIDNHTWNFLIERLQRMEFESECYQIRQEIERLSNM